MNPMMTMNKDKKFFRLKKEAEAQLWDFCIEENVNTDSYDVLRDLVLNMITDAYLIGEMR